MTLIRPFRALRYNPKKVALEKVVAPPYDVISPEYQRELSTRDAYNVIHVELNPTDDPYGNAAKTWEEWKKNEVVVRDREPGLYVYHQIFSDEGKKYERRGFFTAMKLSPFSERIVLPHERTLSGPKRDRLELTRGVKANLSPIFGLYEDERGELSHLLDEVTSSAPIADVTSDDGTRHLMWNYSGEENIRRVKNFMNARQILIADGHHRYETMLAYENERNESDPEHPSHYVLTFLCATSDEGLVVHPTHRLLHGIREFNSYEFLARLKNYFELTPCTSINDVESRLKKASPEATVCGIAISETKEYYFLNAVTREKLSAICSTLPPASQTLELAILHRIILQELLGITPEREATKENISYVHTTKEVEEQLSEHQVALILRPTPTREVMRVAKAGEVMPQKSTYFSPKLLTGLVFHDIA